LVPKYPYSGLGNPRSLHLWQVPADTGPGSLGSYRGLAVRAGTFFPKGERRTLELFSQVASIPIENRSGSFGVVSHGVKNKGYDFAVYTGSDVGVQYPGKVIKVVKNWTPKSHNPNGNEVVVRTVEPDGLVFYIRYSHLLSDINVKVGQYLSPKFSSAIGRAGRTGVPADQRTTYSITAWTPQFGGHFLSFGYYEAVAPETIGKPPNFVDLDPNPDGSSDDPDNDADDPGGFPVSPTGP
jgi:hypothetical protein